MNQARLEPQRARNIVTIVADVSFCDFGVRGQESLHAFRLGKDVGSMAQLRRLSHNRPFQVENVLVAEQVNAACPTRELAVEKGIVVGTPVDLTSSSR